MIRRCPPIILALVVLWSASVCHSFSFDPSVAARRSLRTSSSSFVRHQHQTSSSYSKALPQSSTACPNPNRASLTIRWHSPTESNVETTPTRETLDLHPPTIQAIATALLIRAQNQPNMPIRFVDNGSMEPWEVTLAAGKIAQGVAEGWANEKGLSPKVPADEEVMQVLAGRVVGVVSRLEELEEELLNRCCKDGNNEDSDDGYLGVPEEEVTAWQSNSEEKSSAARMSKAAAAIDAACLFDEKLRYNRARSLLAMFLHEIEGPSLRRANVVIPCMAIDFMSEDECTMLFASTDKEKEAEDDAIANSAKDEEIDKQQDVEEENQPPRPSLHPIALDAIEEAFRLRAQNSTTSPLRILDAQMEWFEVQYSIVKFADRFLEKYTKPSSKSRNGDNDELKLTEEELQSIGGRIVGVLMRLDDLEWEWNHRINNSPLAQVESPSMIPRDLWKATLGLHPGENIEQKCLYTVDMALIEEQEFARTRAEKMLGLFLLNIEGPGLKASGNEVPGGSDPDFIEDVAQLELMMPRPRKE